MNDTQIMDDTQHQEPEADLTKGKPKRGLQAVLLAVFAIAIAVWMFWPAESKVKKIKETPVDVDPDRAAREVINSAKADATKKTPANDPSQPGADPSKGAATPAPIPMALQNSRAPGMPVPAQEDPTLKKRREQERQEEIWASGIQTFQTESIPTARTVAPAPYDPSMALVRGQQPATDASDAERIARNLIAASSPPARTDQGRTATDRGFLQTAASTSIAPPLSQMDARAFPRVHQGTFVRGVLLTGINSDLPGSVVAQVTSDVYDSVNARFVLIPKGSRLIGLYHNDVAIGQSRLLFAFTRLIRPDGSTISLASAQGADMQGAAGLAADVDNHFWKMFGSSLLVGGASLLLPKSQQNITVNVGSTGDTQSGGAIVATTLAQVTQTMMERNRVIAPTLTVAEGSPFLFIVTQDMALTPYRGNP